MDSSIQHTSVLSHKPMLSARDLVRGEIARNLPEGITDREIAQALGMDINCVTGRRNELVGAGEVVLLCSRPCSVTGRMVNAWGFIETSATQVRLNKFLRVEKLTAGDLRIIAECLDKSIDSRAHDLAHRCRLLGGA